MNFRTDINGLRAYAVIAVILFHFNKSWLPGGFAGVDVFFVISGYLMTGIIFRSLENNSLSLRRFYSARVRRIVPALLFVITILIILGYLLIGPGAYYTLAKHAGSSLLFISNFIYKNESGYFDASALSKYLLHTWSLSVEWQFYILYPFLLSVLAKFFSLKNLKRLILFSTLIAFIGSLILSSQSATFSYFLLPARIWEMLLGGIAYLYAFNIQGKWKQNAIEIIGLILIISSFFIVSENTLWPGYMALLPTLGAFLLIQATNQHSIFTNNPVCQKLGLWSYSLYLYHWPILAFNHQFNLDLSIWAFLGLTLSLSIASYYFIETRKWQLKTVLISFTLVFMTLLMIYLSKGAGFRVEEKFRLTPSEYHSQYYGGSEYITPFGEGYINASETEDFDFLLIGDSFSRQYAKYLSETDIKIKTWTADGCLITQSYLQPEHYTEDDGVQCLNISQKTIAEFQNSTKDLIWVQNWAGYKDSDFSPLKGGGARINHTKVILDSIQFLVETNRNVKIYLIGNTFYPTYNSYACNANSALPLLLYKRNTCVKTIPRVEIPINSILKNISEKYKHVYYIDPNPLLCKENECAMYSDDNNPIFSDMSHLSIYGSLIIGNYLFNEIAKIKAISK